MIFFFFFLELATLQHCSVHNSTAALPGMLSWYYVDGIEFAKLTQVSELGVDTIHYFLFLRTLLYSAYVTPLQHCQYSWHDR